MRRRLMRAAAVCSLIVSLFAVTARAQDASTTLTFQITQLAGAGDLTEVYPGYYGTDSSGPMFLSPVSVPAGRTVSVSYTVNQPQNYIDHFTVLGLIKEQDNSYGIVQLYQGGTNEAGHSFTKIYGTVSDSDYSTAFTEADVVSQLQSGDLSTDVDNANNLTPQYQAFYQNAYNVPYGAIDNPYDSFAQPLGADLVAFSDGRITGTVVATFTPEPAGLLVAMAGATLVLRRRN